jgi:hypothetical protein
MFLGQNKIVHRMGMVMLTCATPLRARASRPPSPPVWRSMRPSPPLFR